MLTVALASIEIRRRVVRPIGLGVDLLQLLEDGIGLLDFFWGRHLATLVSR